MPSIKTRATKNKPKLNKYEKDKNEVCHRIKAIVCEKRRGMADENLEAVMAFRNKTIEWKSLFDQKDGKSWHISTRCDIEGFMRWWCQNARSFKSCTLPKVVVWKEMVDFAQWREQQVKKGQTRKIKRNKCLKRVKKTNRLLILKGIYTITRSLRLGSYTFAWQWQHR